MKINDTSLAMSMIPTSYFIWTADFTGACIVLFILIVLDLLTGVRKAQKQGCLQSRIAFRKTSEKLINYGTFLLVGYVINMFFLSLEPSGYVAIFLMNLIGEMIEYMFIGFVGFLLGVEGYSILENLAELGMPIPQKIIKNWSKNVKNNTCETE